MLIIYDTLTGNTERFVKKLDSYCLKLNPDLIVKEDFILVTYTYFFGKVPKKTESFLENNYTYLKGVSSSGNRNWGKIELGGTFGKAANIISEKYNVPVIHKFELSGLDQDVKIFLERCNKLGLY